MGTISSFLSFYGHGKEIFSEFLQHVDREIRCCRETALCEVMRRHGSDKGSLRHNYTILYHHLFKEFLGDPDNVFELGVGTNFLDVAANMGTDGVPGASLRGWREYFPSAAIYGADIDRRVLFQEERIATLYVDQTDPASVNSLWHHIQPSFDLIIDDGMHDLRANATFLEHSKERLLDSGIYIIEDIVNASEILVKYDKLFDSNGMSGFMYRLPHLDNYYNNIVAVICGSNVLKSGRLHQRRGRCR